MVFNSIQYLIFFLIIFGLYYVIQPKYRWVLMLIGSYFFYMSWKPVYILLIIFSTSVDYYVSNKMYRIKDPKLKKKFLIGSIIVNLSLLFFFKYYNFFNDSISTVLGHFNVIYHPIISTILLPVGLSFYTFQSLSFNIDVYKGKVIPERHIGKFALYISFFPQLVAGPIERATNLLPQIQRNDSNLTYQNFAAGLSQLLFGLFKKVVVADTAAIYVNSVYNNYEFYTGSTLLIATYIFALQIYCDFSGYSDMAIGSARMLGYNLMENFRIPYFSKSVTEFWRRWHISLSSWLRDYLYIPLGGNRKGVFFAIKNLILTMLLGGLWHGASWNFVIWGALNGFYLAIERILNWNKIEFNKNIFSKSFYAFLTFNLISLSWIFFRAQSFDQSLFIIKEIFHSRDFFNFQIIDTSIFANIIIGTAILLLFEYFVFRKANFIPIVNTKSLTWVILFCTVMLMLVILFGISEGSQFIYFQF